MFFIVSGTLSEKVLNHYWPDAISYDDITKTDFTKHNGTIDIISGGFPCQPYSTAGKRKGKEDERHLWPQMLRAIREIQPRWVVGENVFGLTNWNGGLVFDEVQKADLEMKATKCTRFYFQLVPKTLPTEGIGFGFVPQVVYEIFKAIEQYELLMIEDSTKQRSVARSS
jgi:DNA (cytosine-5)-methyltransferase 1